MPPKAKITKEMIVDAGFKLVRESGPDTITAQAVAKVLGCSTQPVMSHFKKVEDLRTAVTEKADQYHSTYLLNTTGNNTMMEIGINYIRFAKEEPNLFRLLFQSGSFLGTSMLDILNDPKLQPILKIFSQDAGISLEDAGRAFKALFLTVHGYASMFVSNEIKYNEREIETDLTLIFEGTICSLKERKDDV